MSAFRFGSGKVGGRPRTSASVGHAGAIGPGLGWELVDPRREHLRRCFEALRPLPASDEPENRIGLRVTARW